MASIYFKTYISLTPAVSSKATTIPAMPMAAQLLFGQLRSTVPSESKQAKKAPSAMKLVWGPLRTGVSDSDLGPGFRSNVHPAQSTQGAFPPSLATVGSGSFCSKPIFSTQFKSTPSSSSLK